MLQFVETQVAAPGPHEVGSGQAIGINRAESMWRAKMSNRKIPSGLGYDAAGLVDAVGKRSF